MTALNMERERAQIRELATEQHSAGCSCEFLIENGRNMARKWLRDGLISTADHRGWADAVTLIAASLSDAAAALPPVYALALQFAGAAVTLDDLAPGGGDQ